MSEIISRFSFRDTDVFVCRNINEIYRIVFKTYEEAWKAILNNGLLEHPLVFSHKKNQLRTYLRN